jgi:hypothetical protein
MMAKLQSQGACQLCGQTFVKSAMSRHVTACLAKHQAEPPVKGRAKPRVVKSFLLAVEGKGAPEYWLHVLAPANGTLGDLDGFLRTIWLECCGHMSAFEFPNKKTIPAMMFEDPFGDWADDDNMSQKLSEVLSPGLKFSYDYDFGSTTSLTLKVAGEVEGPAGKKGDIRLPARNDPPVIPCGVCGAPATQVHTEEACNDEGWVCDQCAGKGKDMDESYFLPVVNSPRTGVCAYTG